MVGTWFDEFAGIYHALAHLGCPPPVADEMELWQVAAVLGQHLPPEVDEVEDPYADFDPIKARVEAAKKGEPPPTRPTSRAQAAGVRTLRPIPGPGAVRPLRGA